MEQELVGKKKKEQYTEGKKKGRKKEKNLEKSLNKNGERLCESGSQKGLRYLGSRYSGRLESLPTITEVKVVRGRRKKKRRKKKKKREQEHGLSKNGKNTR
ncbi:hypothetical protein NO371_17130 [Escherichia coli]|nr:hypothetical protein [Escherichia coli]